MTTTTKPVAAPTYVDLTDGTRVPLIFDPAKPLAPQVQAALPPCSRFAEMSGQGAALLCALAISSAQTGDLPGGVRFPIATGQEPAALNLSIWRHVDVRDARVKLPREEWSPEGFVIDFGVAQGVSPERLAQIRAAVSFPVSDRIYSVHAGQFPPDADGRSMWRKGLLERLVALQIPEGAWASGRVVICLPGLSFQGVVAALAVYGLSHSWPHVVRFGGPAQGFAVQEVVDLPELAAQAVAALRQPAVQVAGGAGASLQEQLEIQTLAAARATRAWEDAQAEIARLKEAANLPSALLQRPGARLFYATPEGLPDLARGEIPGGPDSVREFVANTPDQHGTTVICVPTWK